MENLELIFENIKTSDINSILKWMDFSEENIVSSHFFINNEDKEYRDIVSFSDYFKSKGTCNILVKNLDLGVLISKAIMIISFDETYGDLTLNFSEEEWGTNDHSEEEKIAFLSEKLKMLNTNIHYSSILFGYEPADDEDMELLKVSK